MLIHARNRTETSRWAASSEQGSSRMPSRLQQRTAMDRRRQAAQQWATDREQGAAGSQHGWSLALLAPFICGYDPGHYVQGMVA